MTQEILRFFDAVGTVAFAMSGAFKAIRHRLDLLGILVLGFATAMGGGMVRDVLLQRVPAALLSNGPALYSVLGCALAVGWHLRVRPDVHLAEGKAFLVVDALGLAVFAVTGARLGAEAGLTNWSAVLLAAVTGVGGGAIRDMLVCEVPLVLRADFYATAALAGGFVFTVLYALALPAEWPSLCAFVVTLVLRVMAIFHGWRLPRLPK